MLHQLPAHASVAVPPRPSLAAVEGKVFVACNGVFLKKEFLSK
jgi:hypothetical protein